MEFFVWRNILFYMNFFQSHHAHSGFGAMLNNLIH